MIHSIQLLTKELKSTRKALKRAKNDYEQGLLIEMQYSSQVVELNFKISQLESDIETLEKKHTK